MAQWDSPAARRRLGEEFGTNFCRAVLLPARLSPAESRSDFLYAAPQHCFVVEFGTKMKFDGFSAASAD